MSAPSSGSLRNAVLCAETAGSLRRCKPATRAPNILSRSMLMKLSVRCGADFEFGEVEQTFKKVEMLDEHRQNSPT